MIDKQINSPSSDLHHIVAFKIPVLGLHFSNISLLHGTFKQYQKHKGKETSLTLFFPFLIFFHDGQVKLSPKKYIGTMNKTKQI